MANAVLYADRLHVASGANYVLANITLHYKEFIAEKNSSISQSIMQLFIFYFFFTKKHNIPLQIFHDDRQFSRSTTLHYLQIHSIPHSST
jgi:hypothetical protein